MTAAEDATVQELDKHRANEDISGLSSSISKLVDSAHEGEAHETILAPSTRSSVPHSTLLKHLGDSVSKLASRHHYGVYTVSRKTGNK